MLKRLATLLCCCLSFVVSAAQVTDLYQGKAPTSGDMTAAQSQALGDVLDQGDGQARYPHPAGCGQGAGGAGGYVQQYSYQDIGRSSFSRRISMWPR
jgi:hypothetical protein